jgi:hypothetical protein
MVISQLIGPVYQRRARLESFGNLAVLRERPMGYALSRYQAPTRINVPEADASAVVQSLEKIIPTELAIKGDITLLRAEMQHGFSVKPARHVCTSNEPRHQAWNAGCDVDGAHVRRFAL